MTERNRLQQAGERLLPSLAYGDAAGVPVETKSYEEIADAYGALNTLIPPENNPFFEGKWPVGTTSDDTQLSVAVARALIRAGRFDLQTHAEEHAVAYHETPKAVKPSGRRIVRGWGGSTTAALERIVLEGVSPYESGTKDGSGNGILMKMAPLAYWHEARGTSDEQRYAEYDALTTMTHDGDVARITTRVHGDVLRFLMRDDANTDELGAVAYASATRHEKTFGTTSDVTGALELLRQKMRPTPEDVQDLYAPRAEDPSKKRFGFRYSFYAPETLLVAYAAFLHGRGDFHKSVFTAVNLGGDADSTASIVGGMQALTVRANYDMPRDAEALQDADGLRELSRALAAAALSEK